MFIMRRCSLRNPVLVNLVSTSTVVRNNNDDGFKKPDELLIKSQETKTESEKLDENTGKSKVATEEETECKTLETKEKNKVDLKQLFSGLKIKRRPVKSESFQKVFVKSARKVADEFQGSPEMKEELIHSFKKISSKGTGIKELLEVRHQRKPQSSEVKSTKQFSFETVTQNLGFFNLDTLLEKENKENVLSHFLMELEQKELSYFSKGAPRNYFDEMIMWTNEGKLWHFPIDNDQGRYDEANVHFTEHVFLDPHLEPWCPKVGPLRHFMELVVVGLSKNPYLSVKEKVEHIEWFREYFEKKKKLLTEVGAFSPKPLLEEKENKAEERRDKQL